MLNKLILTLILLTCGQLLKSQNVITNIGDAKRGDFRVMFYNVENLFDPFDDTLRLDNEFLPKGERHWTWEKYKKKSQQISKVIMAAGSWDFPDLIGLCEIENRFVLDGIFKFGYLKQIGYKIIHRDSPDHRGIDVALIYQPERFRPIDTTFLQVHYAVGRALSTREILYVKGIAPTKDTLHIFVNHWPSRWGGQLESEHKRISAAKVLHQSVDSILKVNSNALVIVMGDFNDYPDNESIRKVLGALPAKQDYLNDRLYNLAYSYLNKSDIGSHKYHGKWGMLDQFMVSGSLLNKASYLYCEPSGMSIFAPDFLLEKDKTYYGVKPFRTFAGYKYQGGFSDHLPVLLDLWRK
ncbi:endonuclease [Ancylomarina longa]|uniref:Endonuclease n=1 Tax=Ancylomarina longa TaxID=2487017 RepID=A0A434AGP9_9BACT|nr:endonuclease [Ancylomarina longa]RUT73560.1 endonuclease [Ancylomarina longa]